MSSPTSKTQHRYDIISARQNDNIFHQNSGNSSSETSYSKVIADPAISRGRAVSETVNAALYRVNIKLELQSFQMVFKGESPVISVRARRIYFMNTPDGGGGGTLGISGWGCAAGTLEPLAYTRASFS